MHLKKFIWVQGAERFAPERPAPIRRARFIVAVPGYLSRWPLPVIFSYMDAERTGETWVVRSRGHDKSGPTNRYAVYERMRSVHRSLMKFLNCMIAPARWATKDTPQ